VCGGHRTKEGGIGVMSMGYRHAVGDKNSKDGRSPWKEGKA
jgi:hypothetical protein